MSVDHGVGRIAPKRRAFSFLATTAGLLVAMNSPLLWSQESAGSRRLSEFAALDTDRDGAINDDEAERLPALSGNFATADTNADDLIDPLEFGAFLAAIGGTGGGGGSLSGTAPGTAPEAGTPAPTGEAPATTDGAPPVSTDAPAGTPPPTSSGPGRTPPTSSGSGATPPTSSGRTPPASQGDGGMTGGSSR